jgi:lysophospholipase L1-like esterase
VIEEGLNGRTTALDSVLLPGRNGLEYLGPCLDSHAPLDVVIIYLGTSDLADRYAMTAADIARAAGRLATMVAQSAAGVEGGAPRPILVCPPPLGDTTWNEDWAGAPGKADLLPDRFEAVAARLEMDLIDLGRVTRYSPVDGIHLDADGHVAVGELIERTLRELFR